MAARPSHLARAYGMWGATSVCRGKLSHVAPRARVRDVGALMARWSITRGSHLARAYGMWDQDCYDHSRQYGSHLARAYGMWA